MKKLVALSLLALTGCNIHLNEAERVEILNNSKKHYCEKLMKIKTPKQVVISRYEKAYLLVIQVNRKRGIYSPMYFVMPFQGKVYTNKGMPKSSLGQGSTENQAWLVASKEMYTSCWEGVQETPLNKIVTYNTRGL
jgi:hypothetical protein